MASAPRRIEVTLTSAVLHVTDIERTLDFYERAFGLQPRFADESGLYAELETGATALAFTERRFAAQQACATAGGQPDEPAAPCELAFAVDDVQHAFDAALAAGATPVRPPTAKYWGQVVAYVRDPDGHLLQISTPSG
jgi:lactoylglutathione lyase